MKNSRCKSGIKFCIDTVLHTETKNGGNEKLQTIFIEVLSANLNCLKKIALSAWLITTFQKLKSFFFCFAYREKLCVAKLRIKGKRKKVTQQKI